ncbi:MAG: thioredoxin family protein [Pseudomonadota bacterium]
MKLESQNVSLGTPAPTFLLPDGDGKTWSLSDVQGDKATLVAIICNHCPFVVHMVAAFSRFASEYQPKGLSVVAISANDVSRYPADSPERMAEFARQHGFSFPYLYDEAQEVARAFKAVCTPDLFLYDAELKLAYAGQFDASRPGMSAGNGEDLRRAADAVLTGNPVPQPHFPSVGCSIKWKP